MHEIIDHLDEKRRRADIVIRTGLSRYETQRQVRRIVRGLRPEGPNQ